jgi:hypothetical protein
MAKHDQLSLYLNVAKKAERGLLGMYVEKYMKLILVCLYFSESKSSDGGDISKGEVTRNSL